MSFVELDGEVCFCPEDRPFIPSEFLRSVLRAEGWTPEELARACHIRKQTAELLLSDEELHLSRSTFARIEEWLVKNDYLPKTTPWVDYYYRFLHPETREFPRRRAQMPPPYPDFDDPPHPPRTKRPRKP